MPPLRMTSTPRSRSFHDSCYGGAHDRTKARVRSAHRFRREQVDQQVGMSYPTHTRDGYRHGNWNRERMTFEVIQRAPRIKRRVSTGACSKREVGKNDDDRQESESRDSHQAGVSNVSRSL